MLQLQNVEQQWLKLESLLSKLKKTLNRLLDKSRPVSSNFTENLRLSNRIKKTYYRKLKAIKKKMKSVSLEI